jgi:ribosome biogenesis GTPase / thiamine phosphate phosphatase
LSDGIVTRAGRGLYTVQTDTGRIFPCRLRGNLKKRFTYSETASHVRRVEKVKKLAETDPIAVGDRVSITVGDSGIEGVIEQVHPRRKALVRRSGNERERQTLVANLELAVIVFSAAEPRPDLFKLDRFLVLAEDSELEILIILNKADLAEPSELTEALVEYRAVGYEILTTSRITGEGIPELRAALKGRLSAFCGPSGVGKSSLLNAVQPGLRLKTGEISEITHAGRHTTVRAELLTLEIGGWVADTPGLRQVEFWDLLPEDVAFCFPELEPLMGHCKFPNCRHRKEPGCAVRAAVDDNRVSPRRYQSYLQMTATEPARN